MGMSLSRCTANYDNARPDDTIVSYPWVTSKHGGVLTLWQKPLWRPINLSRSHCKVFLWKSVWFHTYKWQTYPQSDVFVQSKRNNIQLGNLVSRTTLYSSVMFNTHMWIKETLPYRKANRLTRICVIGSTITYCRLRNAFFSVYKCFWHVCPQKTYISSEREK